jgi:hypothetical protein
MVVLVRRGTELAGWPLSGWDDDGLAAVDRLARLQLAARRLGWSIELRGAGAELLELLDLAGLAEVVPEGCGLGVEPGGEAEGREQVRVDEVVMPDDPVA